MRYEIRNIKLTTTFLMGIALLSGCGSSSTTKEEKEEKVAGKELSLIEKFDFEDLEGNKIDWADTKGKVVFINFWATWCKPCIKEMPSISEANNQLKDGNVLFIVASDEDIEKIKKFDSKRKYSFPLMRSVTSVFDLDIQALPTTIIIDEKGEVVFNEIGTRDWASEKNIALIKSFSSKL